jgi:hypothetical protein
MTQTAATVRRHVVVDTPIDRAFLLFTKRFGDFKPPEHNLLGAPIAETVFERRVGGHIVDRAVDGTECRRTRILVWKSLSYRGYWRKGYEWELPLPCSLLYRRGRG